MPHGCQRRSPVSGHVPARSYLYVPGDRPDRLQKALDRAGDAVIADLEDAVAPARKDTARGEVAAWLGTLASRSADAPQVWVRVNSGARALDDVAAVTRAGLTGVVVAKADLASVTAVTAAVRAAERAAGLTAGAVHVCPLVETARGMLELAAVAEAAGVSHLAIGEADLAGELGLDPSPDDRELIPLRLQLVVASAAAGRAAPTGPVWTAVRDLDGLAETSQALRRQGFGARSAIHPDQVAVIEDVFTPSTADVSRAREVVAAFDAAGGGGAVDGEGRFVDEAVVRSARRTVAIADRLGL